MVGTREGQPRCRLLAGAALDAVARAVTLLSPMPPHDSDRKLHSSSSPYVRTVAPWIEVAFLAGLSPQRLRALMTGAPATAEEVDGLRRCLPDWQQRPR